MISPGAAEFCMISFAVISITNCGFDEKMQGFFAIIGERRENLVTNGLVTSKFRNVFMGIQTGIADTEVWDPRFLFGRRAGVGKCPILGILDITL